MKREYLNKRDKDQMIASNGTIRKPVEIYQYTAGDNVAISDDHVISAVDTTYTAGQNVSISEDNVISAVDTTYTAGQNVQISDNNVISATDTKYTAGSGISIDANNVISATGGGGGDEFVFTLTPISLSDGMRIENSSDKTASEIITAYNNGKTILGVMKFNQQEYFFNLVSNVAGAPVTKITLSGFNSDRTLPSFFELSIDSGSGAIQIGWAPDSFKGRICRYGDLVTTINQTSNPPTSEAVYNAIHNIPVYTLPTASANTLGGVKVGSGLSIDGNGVLSASGGASYSAGAGISIDANNVISNTGIGSMSQEVIAWDTEPLDLPYNPLASENTYTANQIWQGTVPAGTSAQSNIIKKIAVQLEMGNVLNTDIAAMAGITVEHQCPYPEAYTGYNPLTDNQIQIGQLVPFKLKFNWIKFSGRVPHGSEPRIVPDVEGYICIAPIGHNGSIGSYSVTLVLYADANSPIKLNAIKARIFAYK